MRRVVQRVARSATGWGLLATALRFAAGLSLLPLMLRRIPPEELGLWYVFVSLEAFAVLLDLGFAHAVGRAAGYLWAGAPALLPFGIAASEIRQAPNVAALADLAATLRNYYRAAGAVLFLFLGSAGGAWIWHKSAGLTNAESLRLAFLAYAVSVAFGFANSLWPSLLAGLNAVRRAQQIVCVCSIVYLLLGLAGLLAGWKIWALILASFGAALAEWFLGRAFLSQIIDLRAGRSSYNLLRVLWPNAWRTGAVGLGAYLILQANTLICSAFLDLKTTASYGLSLQAVTLLVAVSSVWVSVQLPAINQLRAQGLFDRIARIFRQRIALALGTFLAGGVALLSLGQWLLGSLHSQTLLLPIPLLAVLLLIQFLEMHHALYGELVYSENINPFVRPALLSGAAIVCLSSILTPRLGVWGMLLATGLVQLCFNNWWPVRRAIRGLGPAGKNYWRGFISAPPSSGDASDR